MKNAQRHDRPRSTTKIMMNASVTMILRGHNWQPAL